MRRALIKSLERGFPSSANHFQLALSTSSSTSSSSSSSSPSSSSSSDLSQLSAKELLSRIVGGDVKQSSDAHEKMQNIAQMFVQATLAIKKASVVFPLR
jgi:exo-beta-1,3-glucanase (GH17 family)